MRFQWVLSDFGSTRNGVVAKAGVARVYRRKGGGKKKGRQQGSSEGFVHFYKNSLSERLLQKGFLQRGRAWHMKEHQRHGAENKREDEP